MENLKIDRMTEAALDECVDLFIDVFTREPWNDGYDSREQVVRFFKMCIRDSRNLLFSSCRLICNLAALNSDSLAESLGKNRLGIRIDQLIL